MSEIKSFSFSPKGINDIRNYKYGTDWPVVYILENGKEVYVGETIRAYARAKEHIENIERKRLKTIHLFCDDESNKSAALDIESSLIEYMVADGKFKIQNGNKGLQNHNYYDRERYQSKFEVLWEELRGLGLANKEWREIKNSDLFKYSPYKTLTDDQYLIAREILTKISEQKAENFIIHGGPGTGKTIVAVYLIKRLVDEGVTNIGLVIAMTALRNTLKKVFRSIPGLSSSMVIGPAEAVSKEYDVLFVDEAHRLRRRKNITNYRSHDQINKKLGLGNEGDELDWVLRSSKQVVLFYDENQSVRPSDVLPKKISDLKAEEFHLKSQMRVKGGESYLQFVEKLLEGEKVQLFSDKDYDFKIFTDFTRFLAAIKHKEKEHSLSRLVAGYAWEWKSKKDPNVPDIEIDDQKLFWNSRLTDWVNSENAPNEVGCIHTIQGYDLNYAGVIIGPELSYDKDKEKIFVKRSKYRDANGHQGVEDPNELHRYIINIYKTLMTRGILGTYIYVVDEDLRNYFLSTTNKKITSTKSFNDSYKLEPLFSPYQNTVQVPLFESVGCGEAMVAEAVSDDFVDVPQELIKKGAKYFALRTRGDSMNKLGIEDGDIILCQKNYQAPSGSIAVVMIGEDATLKEIRYQKDGLLLVSHSRNKKYQDRLLNEDDEFKVLGTYIKKLDINS